ncbi:MAG TPA: hypothetical protein VLA47_07965 [Nitrospira sp.]|nr:hypothetical protein [Nitrospira sp.]
MVRHFGQSFFLFFLTVCAALLLAAAYTQDCLGQGSAPLHAQDQLPGTGDGQTEPDQGKGELEELALAQGEPFRIVHLTRTCIHDGASCPRAAFLSDWFRPPALS